jgi:hypothetical protein
VINLQNDLSTRNRAPAANRRPDHSALMLAARQIERKYNTSPGMALVVAELVGASIEARQ